jgi:hypothetical protein
VPLPKRLIIEGRPHTAWVILDGDAETSQADIRITPKVEHVSADFLNTTAPGASRIDHEATTSEASLFLAIISAEADPSPDNRAQTLVRAAAALVLELDDTHASSQKWGDFNDPTSNQIPVLKPGVAAEI